MKKVTIKELARELQLSLSTVSKALRDSYEISRETKLRVQAMAQQLNYTPDAYASSLRGRKSKNIAVIIPEVADSFFSLAINGIEAAVKEKGYHVLIYLTHERFADEKAILAEFRSGRVDGVLLSVSRETASGTHINDLIAHEVPVVFFDRVLEDVPAPKIVTDDFYSGYTATRHLIENGCKKIAYLGISNSLSISNNRMEGYLKALADHGLTVRKRHIIGCTTDAAHNLLLVKKLLQQQHAPDGIIASVEKLTVSVYQACQALGLSIPGAVKLVCFSNLEIATILHPSLTTITQPAFEMGRAAADVLLQLLHKKQHAPEALRMVIPSQLVVRNSSSR